jgi:hypothetical protein
MNDISPILRLVPPSFLIVQTIEIIKIGPRVSMSAVKKGRTNKMIAQPAEGGELKRHFLHFRPKLIGFGVPQALLTMSNCIAWE